MRLNRTRKIIAGGALAGSLMLTGLVGLAQQPQATQGQGDRGRAERHFGGKEGRGGFGGRMFERLNLTDAQRAQMEQIAARFRESTSALRQQERAAMRNGGGEHSGAFTDGAFNEAAVRAAAQARANARVEMEVARARMMHEMYNVLTAEQKAQLAAERQQREQQRQEWRSRRGATEGKQVQ